MNIPALSLQIKAFRLTLFLPPCINISSIY